MGFVFLVVMKEKLDTLKRLQKLMSNVDLVSFLKNYTIQNHLPFRKNRRGLLDTVYPELKKFSSIYFSHPFSFLKTANLLNAYILGGFEALEDSLSYSEKDDFISFIKNFQKTSYSLVEFYDGLTTLVKVCAHQNSINYSDLLDDKESLREIHKRVISREGFKQMEDKRWNLYVSLIKVLPEKSDYSAFFNDLFVKAAEANRVMAGYADNPDAGFEFMSPRIMGVSESIIKSRKINFAELKEGLKFFKEDYHDRVVEHVLKTYF